MPTGYTAGIIDGKIKTFPEFAKLCMRAFGATIHMRDESMTAEYEPRVPSDYHTKEIEKANEVLSTLKKMTDEEIVSKRKTELEESKQYHLKHIETAKQNTAKLNEILAKAKQFVPPTTEHTGIKDFMIKQIEETIDWDGKTNYHDEALLKIESELSSLDVDVIRADMFKLAYKDLTYHTKEYNADVARCAASNKWVEDFLTAIH